MWEHPECWFLFRGSEPRTWRLAGKSLTTEPHPALKNLGKLLGFHFLLASSVWEKNHPGSRAQRNFCLTSTSNILVFTPGVFWDGATSFLRLWFARTEPKVKSPVCLTVYRSTRSAHTPVKHPSHWCPDLFRVTTAQVVSEYRARILLTAKPTSNLTEDPPSAPLFRSVVRFLNGQLCYKLGWKVSSKESLRLELEAGPQSSRRPGAKAMQGIYLDPNPVETNTFYALFKLVSVMTFRVTGLL